MFGQHSQSSQLRLYSKEPEGPPEVPLVEAQPDEGQEIGADDFTGRQGNTDWCSCQKCGVMQRAVDYLRCRESAAAVSIDSPLTCVTHPPDFASACLNKTVLTICLTAYREFRDPRTRTSEVVRSNLLALIRLRFYQGHLRGSFRFLRVCPQL